MMKPKQTENKKLGAKMKTTITVMILLAATFLQTSAHATCEGNAFDGVFKNARGDRFKFEQSDCNHLRVTDLQLGDAYTASTDGYTLQAQPTATESVIGSVGRSSPISLRLDQPHDGMSFRRISIRFKLPFMGSIAGVTAPIIETKLDLWPYYNIDPQGNSHLFIAAQTTKVLALHSPGESDVQRAFVEGLNLGLGLLDKIGFRISEGLDRE